MSVGTGVILRTVGYLARDYGETDLLLSEVIVGRQVEIVDKAYQMSFVILLADAIEQTLIVAIHEGAIS